MNSNPHNLTTSESASESAFSPAEETLRLIASLPAPDGLEDRVNAALSAAPRRSRVLAWPRAIRPESGWMRTAAAAAIVFVVAGGGWGVYTRVEHNQPAKVIVMPARMPAPGGFSGAGAMRTPLTLPGPAAPQPAKASEPAKADESPRASLAQTKTAKKPAARAKTTSNSSGQPRSTRKTAAQPDALK
jgi:hypothetical protein